MTDIRGPRVTHKEIDEALSGKGLFGYPAALLTLIIGILVTATLFFQAQTRERAEIAQRLQEDAEDVSRTLKTGIENKLNSLSALRSLFAASREVDQKEFAIFSEHLLRRFREVESFEWIPRVDRQELKTIEAELRRGFGAGVVEPVIYSRGQDGGRLPVDAKLEYYPILYAEPAGRNSPAIGYDQSSSAERFRAMRRSGDTEDIAATRMLNFFRNQDRGGKAFKGFIAYLPVFKSDSTGFHAPKPPQILQGFVATVFRAEDLVGGMLGRSAAAGTRIRISAESGEEGGGEDVLYSSDGFGSHGLTHTEVFDVAGCRWIVRSERSLAPLGSIGRSSTMIIVVGGLLSALLAALLVSMERKKTHRFLSELSMRDELTRLYNRRGFMLLAEEQLRLARRAKTGFWILAIDLDGLKRVNDTRGHAEGDRTIRRAAGILSDSLRESDIVARIGGDEFVALVIEAGPKDGDVVVEHLRAKALAEAAANPDREPVSFSVGAVFVSPLTQTDLLSWMRQADKALYQDKNSRKRPGVKPGH